MATSSNAEDLPHVGVPRTMPTNLNAEGSRLAIRAPTKRFFLLVDEWQKDNNYPERHIVEWQKYDCSPKRHIVVANCSKNHTLQGSMGSVASSTHHVYVRLNSGETLVISCGSDVVGLLGSHY
jgi:hypothetical protein